MKQLSSIDGKRVLEALLNQKLTWEMMPSNNTPSRIYMSNECTAKNNINFKFKIVDLNEHVVGVSFIIENGGEYDSSLEFMIDSSLLFSEQYEQPLTELLNDIVSNDYVSEVLRWMDHAAYGGPVNVACY